MGFPRAPSHAVLEGMAQLWTFRKHSGCRQSSCRSTQWLETAMPSLMHLASDAWCVISRQANNPDGASHCQQLLSFQSYQQCCFHVCTSILRQDAIQG